VTAAVIRFYRRYLTRFTPACGRVGPSCSQTALQSGLVAGLLAFTRCEDCRGRGA
jgi:putative component of membrane protein insertase Oxa1/YidC/SpoIIIJ protein YidD